MTQSLRKTPTIEDHLLRLEIEDFLWDEAELLDDFRYEEWLDLLTDDLVYWMPIRRNVPSRLKPSFSCRATEAGLLPWT